MLTLMMALSLSLIVCEVTKYLLSAYPLDNIIFQMS